MESHQTFIKVIQDLYESSSFQVIVNVRLSEWGWSRVIAAPMMFIMVVDWITREDKISVRQSCNGH